MTAERLPQKEPGFAGGIRNPEWFSQSAEKVGAAADAGKLRPLTTGDRKRIHTNSGPRRCNRFQSSCERTYPGSRRPERAAVFVDETDRVKGSRRNEHVAER